MTIPADDLENGILSVQHLEQAIADGVIAADQPIEPGQLQPASLDLRLGREAWRVQASFLPGKNLTVADKLAKFGMHKIDLSDGAVLERAGAGDARRGHRPGVDLGAGDVMLVRSGGAGGGDVARRGFGPGGGFGGSVAAVRAGAGGGAG